MKTFPDDLVKGGCGRTGDGLVADAELCLLCFVIAVFVCAVGFFA
jgi:hypothetical protein